MKQHRLLSGQSFRTVFTLLKPLQKNFFWISPPPAHTRTHKHWLKTQQYSTETNYICTDRKVEVHSNEASFTMDTSFEQEDCETNCHTLFYWKKVGMACLTIIETCRLIFSFEPQLLATVCLLLFSQTVQ